MYRRYKFDIWDFIIWISLIVLILYVIGKLIGLINTPELVNLIPIITLVFFTGAFYQKILGFMERMFVRTDYLKKNIDNINGQVAIISLKLTEHDDKLLKLDKKIK